jgi:HemY protein
MRALLWIIAIFALAAGLAMLAGANEGYVLVVMPPWRAQASLNLVIVFLVLAFLTAYFVLRLVSRTLDLPGRVGAFRSRRQREKAARSMRDALRALYEGRFTESLKHAKVAYASGGSSPEAAIVAARAANALHDDKHYREWIGRAGDSDEGKVAQLLTESELALAAGRHDEAGRALDALRALGHRSSAALRLSLELAQAQGRWEQVSELCAQLLANRAITPEQARPIARRAQIERMRAMHDPDALAEYWRSLSKEELGDAVLVEQALPLLAAAGRGAIARRTVDRLLEADWRTDLARHYVLCAGEGDEARDALSRAEKWLARHPEDPGLLYSLGRQCMNAEIWGKAQSYLESSLRLSPSADVHFALAELMERLERPSESTTHFREAARLASA